MARPCSMCSSGTCVVCRSTLLDHDGMWTCCSPCNVAATKYNQVVKKMDADVDFAYHELAHYVMMYRVLPRLRSDWYLIEAEIEQRTIGRAQVHELRTLALQYATYDTLGWRPILERVVGLSWFGLRDFGSDQHPPATGRQVVVDERQAVAYVRRLLPKVSTRLVRLYGNALRRFRGESLHGA